MGETISVATSGTEEIVVDDGVTVDEDTNAVDVVGFTIISITSANTNPV